MSLLFTGLRLFLTLLGITVLATDAPREKQIREPINPEPRTLRVPLAAM